MDELKEIFADGSLTFDEFNTRVTEKGFKLADLSKGGFIAKEKADRQQAKLQAEYDAYKAENDISKFSDYEAIKAERDSLLNEKKSIEMNAMMSEVGVPEQFRKFVISEVASLVNDQKDFKTCLNEYLEQNPQFCGRNNLQNIFFRSTQPPLAGGNGGNKSPNQEFNDWIRGK